MSDIEKVYTEYFTTVYRYVLSISHDPYVAEEMTQETFFKALQNIDRFRGESSLSSWLCQIARNTYLTYCSKENRKTNFLEGWEDTITFDAVEDMTDASAEKVVTDRDTCRQIMKLAAELEQPYRDVFSMRTFGELPFKKIGEISGRTESWARVTYYRAKVKIKEAMDK